mmetsp:Transcript_12811/g.29957  ORF Transcript_12811/g.29957 Transcript_12811/m.29957 type:complete len:428 (+) Transcript_12811:506-1789(+)
MFGTCGALEPFLSVDGVDEIFNLEKKKKVFSWRDDPVQSYSDWAIIVATSEFNSKTYYVHKRILSEGSRKSNFFSKLFREGSNRENPSQSSTRIQLDEQDAESFPLFLDFVYDACQDAENDSDDHLTLKLTDNFTASNAVSLRHLAKVFDCDGLMLAVNKFIQKDLSLRTGPVYLAEAHLYEDKRLMESAKRLCIEHFSRLDTKSITDLPHELFRSVLTAVIKRSKSGDEASLEETNSLSFHLSEVVCQYFEKHPEQLCVQLLLELTDEDAMSKIAPEPAIGITALVRDLNPNEIKTDSDEWRGVIELSQRCARSIVGEYGWKDFNVTSALEEYLNGPCATSDGSSTKLDSLLFATSFAATLESAQNDAKMPSKSQAGKLRQQNDDLRRQNRKMNEEVDKYKGLVSSTKEELLLLKEQIKHLRRLQI